MSRYLERVLNVRRGEFRTAFLLFLYLFLAIGCYYMGVSVGDALFLNAFPTYLPHVIIATAVAMGIFTSIYVRLSHRLRLDLLIMGCLLFFAFSFAGLWWLARWTGAWTYPFIYVWVYMMGALAPTMGWTLANYILTTREARRVFGFIGAGANLGAPCAGFLTADLTHQAHVRPEALLLIIAIGLGLCAVSVRVLFLQKHHQLTRLSQDSGSDPDAPRDLRQVWAHVRASRYLLLITALILVGCASTTIVSYQFKLIASRSFSGNKVALVAFFGRFYGYVGIASFVLQMLVTGRLLRSFGIGSTLLVLPTAFVAGSFGVLLAPTLISACVLKGTQGLLRYSLDKSSTELLYLPVAPPRVKNQIKSFIDGFVWRIADAVAGVALLLFATRLKFDPGRVSLVNLAFLIAWIAIAFAVRREYLRVLRWAIERRTLEPERMTAGVLDSTTTQVLSQAVQHGGEEHVMYGLSLFEVGRGAAWHPALGGLLDHPSSDVRQRALRLLTESGHRELASRVEKMLSDDSVEVRAEALQYLVLHAGRDPLHLLGSNPGVPSYCLQSAVVTYLARTQDPNFADATHLMLRSMLADSGPDAIRTRCEAARALGTIPPFSELHADLKELLGDPSSEVVEQALICAGKVHRDEFLPLVIEKLGQSRLVGAARAALVGYGDLAVDTLQDFLNEAFVSVSVRKQIPAVLAQIGSARCGAVLADSLVQSNPDVRYEVIKALNKLRTRESTLLPTGVDIADMLESELIGFYRSFQVLAALDHDDGDWRCPSRGETLVRSAIRERMAQEFERIFRLLGLLYPARDIHNAYVALTSQRPQLQANALEVLEHLLSPDLYRRLIFGVDPESTPAERLEFARRLCRTGIESREEALRVLLHSDDDWLRTCAVHVAGQGCLMELRADVARLRHDGDAILDETWQWASTRLASGAGELNMLTVLERVDLLRKSPMFCDIPTAGLARVAGIARELNLPPGQMLYSEDSVAESMFFLLEGRLELTRSGRSIQSEEPHQLLGALAMLSGGTHTESAQASEAAKVLQIDMQDFFDALAEDFGAARGVLKSLAETATRAMLDSEPKG